MFTPFLPPTLGIDLTQKCGRDETEAEPAHVGRCYESGHVGNYASAYSKYETAAVDAHLDETAVYRVDSVECFDRFARADHDVFIPLQQGMVTSVDIGIGNHHDAAFRQEPREQFRNPSEVYFALVGDFETLCNHCCRFYNSVTKIDHFPENLLPLHD